MVSLQENAIVGKFVTGYLPELRDRTWSDAKHFARQANPWFKWVIEQIISR